MRFDIRCAVVDLDNEAAIYYIDNIALLAT